MSLESTVSGLVQSTNRLTDEVSGKLKEIDEKVAEATASVPNTIRALSNQNIYIDAADGNDDNSGASGNPLKTIAAVNGKIVNGSLITIWIKGGQTHEITGFGPEIETGVLYVRGWSVDSLGVPTLKFSAFSDGDRVNNYSYGFGVRSGALIFQEVNIETHNYDNGKAINDQSGLFRVNLGSAAVFFRQSKVTMNDCPLATAYPGYEQVDMSLNMSEITVGSNTNGRGVLIGSRGSTGTYPQFRFGIYATAVTSGESLSELLPVNAERTNILTNADLSTF